MYKGCSLVRSLGVGEPHSSLKNCIPKLLKYLPISYQVDQNQSPKIVPAFLILKMFQIKSIFEKFHVPIPIQIEFIIHVTIWKLQSDGKSMDQIKGKNDDKNMACFISINFIICILCFMYNASIYVYV